MAFDCLKHNLDVKYSETLIYLLISWKTIVLKY